MLNVKEEDIDKITEAFYLILKGKKPAAIELPEDYPDNEIKQAVSYINKFINEYNSSTDWIYNLSRGDLSFEAPKGQMLILQSLKNLQASLRHLTWATQQISNGDFSQEVDFMGDFSAAFNSAFPIPFRRNDAENAPPPPSRSSVHAAVHRRWRAGAPSSPGRRWVPRARHPLSA